MANKKLKDWYLSGDIAGNVNKIIEEICALGDMEDTPENRETFKRKYFEGLEGIRAVFDQEHKP